MPQPYRDAGFIVMIPILRGENGQPGSYTMFYFGDQEGWATLSTQRAAELAKHKGLDAEAIELPGDHFSSVPVAIRKSIEFFRLK